MYPQAVCVCVSVYPYFSARYFLLTTQNGQNVGFTGADWIMGHNSSCNHDKMNPFMADECKLVINPSYP